MTNLASNDSTLFAMANIQCDSISNTVSLLTKKETRKEGKRKHKNTHKTI